MSYLYGSLVTDLIPRLAKIDKPSGITVQQAANAVQAMINKELAYRKSDLAVTDQSSEMKLPIPSLGYYATLPDGFISMAEKPKAEDLFEDWMQATALTYNPVTGALTAYVTDSNGSDTLASWNIAQAATPDSPSKIIGASTTSLTVTGPGTTQSLTITAGLSLVANDPIWITPTDLPSNWMKRRHHLDPEYLDNEDDEHERTWWEWYGIYGESWEPPCIRPRRYQIVGTTIYVRPKVIVNVNIVGKYYKMPSVLSQPTDAIPWNGLFDEIFREGIVKIIVSGSTALQADAAFMAFFSYEIGRVLTPRARILPSTRRLKRGAWM